ncbi:hypothetical protein L209DRAFT_756005 [Thermothelomyces heterothallicus CBS 203.75]
MICNSLVRAKRLPLPFWPSANGAALALGVDPFTAQATLHYLPSQVGPMSALSTSLIFTPNIEPAAVTILGIYRSL